MKEFILLMYNDAANKANAGDGGRWSAYLSGLRASGCFDGGSAVGPGVRVRQGCADLGASTALDGFLRVRAIDLDAARQFLVGNPLYEAGGTVEIRELPVDE